METSPQFLHILGDRDKYRDRDSPTETSEKKTAKQRQSNRDSEKKTASQRQSSRDSQTETVKH